MDAPQSRADVDPIERELRRLDDALRIEWEPRAVLVSRGRYDAMGKMIDPTYDGRWKVVKKGDVNRTAMWREDGLVCYLTTPMTVGSGERKLSVLTADGPYMPVGPWVVDHFRAMDRAARSYLAAKYREDLDAANDAVDAEKLQEGEAVETEMLEQMFFDARMRGGVATAHPVRTNLTTE